MTAMLPSYKPTQPVKELVLVSEVDSPLYAPVTLNSTNPSYFWMDIHSLVLTHHLRFPVAAEINPKMQKKHHSHSRDAHLLWLPG